MREIDTLIPMALENGGTKLDCYGDTLANLYAKYGFIPVARVEFNEAYANPGWTPDKGTPDIYFMMHSCYHTRQLLQSQDKCQWGVEGSEEWRGLFGRTAGIIGLGNNGRQLASRLHALGMRLITYDRFYNENLGYIDRQLVSSNGDSLDPLLEDGTLVMTNPDNPGDVHQKYVATRKVLTGDTIEE